MSKPRHARGGVPRLRIGSLAALASALVLSPLAAGADGELDPTFGTGGKVVTDLGADERAVASAIQADGKIVVAGGDSARRGDFLIVRYRSDGSLDPSFGSAGRVYTDFGGDDTVAEVAIQPDGKIVAAGSAERTEERNRFGVVRYTANGTLDPSFGKGGKVRTGVGVRGVSSAAAIALQGNGKIVLAGVTLSTDDYDREDYDLALVRYNRNGSLDRSFGRGGKVVTSFAGGSVRVLGIAIDWDGKVVAGAAAGDGGALARYNRDGSLDKSFGNAGKVTDPDSGDLRDFAVQPDGRILLAGQSRLCRGATFPKCHPLTRYRRNGEIDFYSFGEYGRVLLVHSAQAVAVQRDGKIVAVGVVSVPPDFAADFAVWRLKTNGDLDDTFGRAGITTIDIGSNSHDSAQSVNVQSDGKIFVAGHTRRSRLDHVDFALVRLLSPAPRCVVPNVRGKRLAAARKALARRSCSVGRVMREASTRVKKGRVISQSRRPGTRLPNRSKVDLVVSSGRS